MAAGASLLMAGTSLASGLMESTAARSAGRFERQQAEFNARLAELKAEDAIARGDEDAKRFAKEVKQFKGKQLAAMATQGVALDSKSFENIREETERLSAFDEMQIRNNAWRDAWGLRSEAQQLRQAGRFADMAGKAKARTSLLTGGLQAIGYGAQAYGQWSKGAPVASSGGGGNGGGSYSSIGPARRQS